MSGVRTPLAQRAQHGAVFQEARCWQHGSCALARLPAAAAACTTQCRVEGNPQNRMQFRVTVAAPDAVLAAGLRDVLVAQLLAAP